MWIAKMRWSAQKTDNTMAKGTNNDPLNITQKTDNTMAKGTNNDPLNTTQKTDSTMAKCKRRNNDLQNTTQKTRSRSTNPTKNRCSGRVSSSCSTCGTGRITLVTNPVISHEWEKDRIVNTTNGIYLWSFVTQILRNGYITKSSRRSYKFQSDDFSLISKGARYVWS